MTTATLFHIFIIKLFLFGKRCCKGEIKTSASAISGYSHGITWERGEFFMSLFSLFCPWVKELNNGKEIASSFCIFKTRQLQYLLKSRMLLNLRWHYILHIDLEWKIKIACIFTLVIGGWGKLMGEGLARSHCCDMLCVTAIPLQLPQQRL